MCHIFFLPLAVIVCKSPESISRRIQRRREPHVSLIEHNGFCFAGHFSRSMQAVVGERAQPARIDGLVSSLCVCVLQIIVFMCYGIMLNKWVLQTYQPDFMKSPLVYHPSHRAQVWRFFSYMFMHVGWVLDFCGAGLAAVKMRHKSPVPAAESHFSFFSLEQLGFNALLQLMIGVPLEMVHGILRISLLYMAGVLAGEFLKQHNLSFAWKMPTCLQALAGCCECEKCDANGSTFVFRAKVVPQKVSPSSLQAVTKAITIPKLFLLHFCRCIRSVCWFLHTCVCVCVCSLMTDVSGVFLNRSDVARSLGYVSRCWDDLQMDRAFLKTITQKAVYSLLCFLRVSASLQRIVPSYFVYSFIIVCRVDNMEKAFFFYVFFFWCFIIYQVKDVTFHLLFAVCCIKTHKYPVPATPTESDWIF